MTDNLPDPLDSEVDLGNQEEYLRIAYERIAAAESSEVLDLSHLELDSIPEEVFEFRHLRVLQLEDNNIRRVPPQILNLERLEILSLWNNQQCALPYELGRLRFLEELAIGPGCNLPDSLGALRGMRLLAIGDNRLGAIPDWLFDLHMLEDLQLWSNGLRELPDHWHKLPNLKELNLASNHLRELPPSIGALRNLVGIKLEENELADLPESMANLPRLRHVRLGHNRFTEVPTVVETWKSLRTLDFSLDPKVRTYIEGDAADFTPSDMRVLNPQTLSSEDRRRIRASTGRSAGLQSLPPGLRALPDLEMLLLYGHPALGLPQEILGPITDNGWQGSVQGLLDYYFRTQESGQPLNEAKLILLGWGGVGKTSLVNRLVHNRFDEDEVRTEGIQVTSWSVTLPDSQAARLNVWDFGGQEIMHATHQFFLTSRSLYLLVLTGRSGSADTDAEYWLRLMQSFAPGSPVIVVMNQIERDPFELDEVGLRQRFPDIRWFVRTDCAVGPGGFGIEQLREQILRETAELPDLRVSFPAAWFAIKDRLSSMQENYLTFDSFRALCRRFGEDDPGEQEKLAGYLHLLGIALNYRDDTRLRDTHVLNPHWVTEGIYAILNSPLVAAQHGEVQTQDLQEILRVTRYPVEKHAFLLDLMRKFELCFPYPDDNDRYLVAELLPKQQPEAVDQYLDDDDPLSFRYRYPVLPEGLLPRFIVRSNVLSVNQPRWRSGCILRWEGNTALVKAEPTDRVVDIAVTGPAEGRRRLLAVIRADFEHIHRSFTFDVEAYVPSVKLPGLAVQYEKLIAAEKAGMPTFPEYFGGDFINIPVAEYLDGVNVGRRRKESSRIRPDQSTPKAAKVFISYSHKDEVHKSTLESHLKLLQRLGVIEVWHDRRIGAGEEWRGAIDRNLREADLVLLLISPDFLFSDYCTDVELNIALQRRTEGNCQVIPVIVRDCNWMRDPRLGELQAVPIDGKAVTTWNNMDTAWRNVSEGIEAAIESQIMRH